ncbi:MAG: hypothetical protein IPN34_08960 [Planctomycetes bacterium]|nr:hypothetical protein [Planctomycetota bacterium]
MLAKVARPLLAALLAAASAAAQSTVVPSSATSARGTSGLNSLLRDAGQPRTYMLGLAATQLQGFAAGDVITGISFRGYAGPANPASWPPVDASFASYEIRIGPARALASWTGSFASNWSSASQLVRSGALRIAAGTFTNDLASVAPAPNAWGDFSFDFEVPYLYAGGDLGIYLTHGGSSLASSFFLDVVSSSAASGLVAYSQLAFQGTGGSLADAFVVRVHRGFGAGCGGSTGIAPRLVSAGDVLGGGTAQLWVGRGLAAAPGAYVLALAPAQLSLAPGCDLLVLPQELLPFALDARGDHRLRAQLPAGILGSLLVQVALIDATAPGGFALSNGVRFTAR